MYKKWTCGVFAVLLLMIGSIVYRGITMDVEDYLKLADEMQGTENYGQLMIQLESALKKSIKKYGDISEETAGIYERMGKAERNLSSASEYFDRAVLIYEILGRSDKVPSALCDKGVKLLGGGEAAAKEAEKVFQKAVNFCLENEIDDAALLCRGYYHLSLFPEDEDAQLEYLSKGEALLPQLKPEQKNEICRDFYNRTGLVYFWQEKYMESLEYWRKLVSLYKDAVDESQKETLADGYMYEGACLAYMNHFTEADPKIKEALELYGQGDPERLYSKKAQAYAYLSLSSAIKEKPDAAEMLRCGEKALSYYTGRSRITNIDMINMEQMKATLYVAYLRAHPGKDEQDFGSWYRKSANLTASSYYYYTK